MENIESNENLLFVEAATLAMLKHAGIDPSDPKNHAHMDESVPGSEINTYKDLAIVAIEAVLETSEKVEQYIENLESEEHSSEDLLRDYREDNFDNHSRNYVKTESDKPEGYSLNSFMTFNVGAKSDNHGHTLGAVRRLVTDLDAIEAPDSTPVTGYLSVVVANDLLSQDSIGYLIDCGDCNSKDVLISMHRCDPTLF